VHCFVRRSPQATGHASDAGTPPTDLEQRLLGLLCTQPQLDFLVPKRHVVSSEQIEVIGVEDGSRDGAVDGSSDGSVDGIVDGSSDGAVDGIVDGSSDGAIDGTVDGSSDGAIDGAEEGERVGPSAVTLNLIICPAWQWYGYAY